MKSNLGCYYWIDIRRCFVVEQLNPNHVLEMFGTFSYFEPDTLCRTAMNMLEDELDYWKHASTVVTQMNFITFDEWCDSMKHENCMCDELMIYILSRLHYCHTIIYTANRPWCTLQNSADMDITELHSKCDLHLVYLGNNTYGQLKHKPMMPAPPTSVPKLPIINKQKYSSMSKATSTASKPIDLSCKADLSPSSVLVWMVSNNRASLKTVMQYYPHQLQPLVSTNQDKLTAMIFW